MTDLTNTMRRLRAPLMAVCAVLALAGCAATNVGEDWQCPLAQGTQCTTVAAADPAVKDGAGATRLADSRRLVPAHRAADDAGLSSVATAAPDGIGRACASRCNPFAWLGRLIAGAPANEGDGTDAAEVREPGNAAPMIAASGEAAAVPEAQPDAPPPSRSAAAGAATEALRAPETIGRVWIAPWVDAGGVYREASWVRIVIAPAQWKRP